MTSVRFVVLLPNYADVMKLVDMLGLDSSAYGVRVRVSPSAPYKVENYEKHRSVLLGCIPRIPYYPSYPRANIIATRYLLEI